MFDQYCDTGPNAPNDVRESEVTVQGTAGGANLNVPSVKGGLRGDRVTIAAANGVGRHACEARARVHVLRSLVALVY